MKCLFVLCIAINIYKITANIQNKAKSYFNSDIAKTFERKWKPYAKMYESTIGFTLQDAFGHNSMNVYINRYVDPLALASGYYHSDNQVKLVFLNVILEALPHLNDIEVSFPLHSHLLQVEASVSKMIVHTDYVLFRNKSDIIFVPEDQDSLTSSPFRFQQVRNSGALAITVEGCSLSGSIVATLSGNTVNLGHHELRLKECQYGIEIYQLNSGAPPVISNYLPNGDTGLGIDNLLLQPLIAELIPKLQAAMISDVNTSSIFNADLPKIRSKQAEVIDETRSYMDDIVRSMNQKSLEKNMGSMNLNDFVIVWDEKFTEIPTAKSVTLSKLILLGLDSVYASHTGGPVRLTELEVLEQLRFGTLQVIGNIIVEGLSEANEFAVEISDFAFDVTINTANKMKMDAVGWRFLEFSCPEMEYIAVESLVVGYLLKELPERLKSHLASVYSGDVSRLNHEYGSFSHEETIDGKYFAHSDEIMNQNKDVDESQEYDNMQLNQKDDVLSDDNIKIHEIKVKSHEEDIIKMQEENSQEDTIIAKLYHVEAELDKTDDEDGVKLHHVEASPYSEEQSDDLNVQLKLNDEEPSEKLKVKLHNVAAEPEKEDQGNIKLHHVAAELDMEDQRNVKLHHVAAEPETDNDTGALRNLEAKPTVAKAGRIKHQAKETAANRSPSEYKANRTAKAVGRKKVPLRGKVRKSDTKVAKLASNQTINNATVLHLSDNEIHLS